MKTTFGTDGIRGQAGTEITTELAFRLGAVMKSTIGTESLIIGHDTRESSPELANALAEGAMVAGTDVILVGVAPTPVIAHYAKHANLDAVVITASHNPYEDNGLKVFKRGQKPSPTDEKAIEASITDFTPPNTVKRGEEKDAGAVFDVYHALYRKLNLEPINLSVVVDCANGATCDVAKGILPALVDEAHFIHDAPDGKNINAGCGATNLDNLIAEVKAKTADLGIAFDGDGDRVMLVDHAGQVVDGESIVYLLARWLKERDSLNKNTVVLTKMANPGLIRALKAEGISVSLTDIGDKYVVAEMRRLSADIGGEGSGHVIVRPYMHTGDGLLVAVLVLSRLQELKLPLASALKNVKPDPLITTNVRVKDKRVIDDKQVKTAIKAAEKTLKDGLLLVRKSGTEPLIRITVSHRDETLMKTAVETIKTAIENSGVKP